MQKNDLPTPERVADKLKAIADDDRHSFNSDELGWLSAADWHLRHGGSE